MPQVQNPIRILLDGRRATGGYENPAEFYAPMIRGPATVLVIGVTFLGRFQMKRIERYLRAARSTRRAMVARLPTHWNAVPAAIKI
jgi:hypothetical protein